VWAVSACGGIVLVTEPLTIALLRRLAVIDVPGGRSSHSVPTPRGGGAPIAVGLLAAAGITRAASRDEVLADLAGLALLVAYLGSPKTLARTRKRYRGAHATTATREV
jgi:UDP-N-acetylmuramyl pentapeptide phosphotransferase/UDP-N-acetylglucosamine-1-phosphate transferase